MFAGDIHAFYLNLKDIPVISFIKTPFSEKIVLTKHRTRLKTLLYNPIWHKSNVSKSQYLKF